MNHFNTKKIGSSFERELANILKNEGYWVHEMVQSSAGQPADLMVVSSSNVTLIECKVSAGDFFPLFRVEPNQIQAMRFFKERTDGETLFFFKFGDGSIRYLEADTVFEMIEKGAKRITYDQTYEYIGGKCNNG